MKEAISYVPVPCMCSGTITSEIREDFTYEVHVYHSPLGKFNGPIYAKNIYTPGTDRNLKQNDKVQIMMSFFYGGADDTFIDYNSASTPYILGRFNERTVANLEVENPNTEDGPDRIRFVNRNSGAGVVVTDAGKVNISSGGSIFHLLNPFGFGVHENSIRSMAQNHQRVVSHNPPLYLSKEYFGMYAGSSIEDRLNFTVPEDFPINLRRFVTQTKSPDNWVSTCEGAYAPWVGANNNLTDKVEIGKEVLFSKSVNYDDSRATIEMGEPGESFINVRIDKILTSEMTLPSSPGATPAVVGNKFKMTISDAGAIDIRGGGAGTPGANTNKFHISFDTDGNMKIHAAGSIEISHGDSDGEINSIKMSPSDGIDVTAKNGFRVNGKPLVNQSYLDWMIKYQTQLCLVTSIGGPAPIHPVALPELISGNNLINDAGGFTTKNEGVPATGLISDADQFLTL